MVKQSVFVLCFSVVGLFVTQPAFANTNNASFLPEHKRGIYYVPDPGSVQHGQPSSIYLNRTGGNFGSGTIPPFEQGDDAWTHLVECVKYQYAPFNVAVTTSNPGGNYILASVGGSAEDIGGSGFCGIAPFACSPMRSATVYNHSECYPGDMDQLCFTVAQEVGHALGLEHQFECTDPMTYLNGCGFKEFQTGPAPCGEFAAVNCQCGGTTQNTVGHLAAVFGSASDSTKPNVSISSPAAGEFVQFGFPINIAATDNRAMGRVELYLDGNLIEEQRFPPYRFKASNAVALGAHTLEVRAYDWNGNSQTATREVVVTTDGNPPECANDGDCPSGEICYNLQCWPEEVDPIQPGETGSDCATNEDCFGGICATSGGESKCTEVCVTDDECPTGFDCVDAGGTGICWPASGNEGDGGGGGCSLTTGNMTNGGGLGALVLLLGTALLVARRRRS